MKSIFLTGSSGFVGINLQSYLSSGFQFKNYNRGETVVVKEDIVIHLAGKAHDTKNVAQPEEYYQVNTELTKKIFDAFMHSTARVFITLSSVKAAADLVHGVLTEEVVPNPQTHYGKSKLLAEQYILAQPLPPGKRVYIIRPCMIHGPGNKGNLNLLYRVVSKNIPWPLAAFNNRRSFCSIENLCFVINELIRRENIPSGIYNVADDEALSTNDLIRCMAESLGRQPKLLSLPTNLIQTLARLGDWLKLPLNSERLQKLTESYVVSNQKIKTAIGKPFPLSAKEGLMRTFRSFNRVGTTTG
ncbi:MAG: NAD-dependent epimerase/dehydratase family protein [Chitinophagaceae bacterium]|jgi:nucleoside-diphosphate-sugar epimerase|nr:NAD-dependent epimerase/dehydratase family protein [Chitinophagaceae bacterium]MCA6483046.1 NAD-dependent epimerase/dehydratase family protein [Chitinophagaceae bacterium]MCA6511696.1 NAD-dependent epimerase/dehydratase family protein [Chitinophagaceae bacterium]MCE2971994.1 NAD-dependent epimerase/dehydratase family protein [Sediminibacterium sp.]